MLKEAWRRSLEKAIDNYGKSVLEVTNLNISCQGLSGHLNLSKFVNLEMLNCNNNQLTDITLPSSLEIKKLFLAWNKSLNLNLESLKKFHKIECLDISGTNASNGLEYLCNSLKDFWCYDSKLLEILNLYSKDEAIAYDFENGDSLHSNHINKLNNWRKNNWRLIKNAQLITFLEDNYLKIFSNLNKSLSFNKNEFHWTRSKLTLNAIYNPNQCFCYWLEEKILLIERLRAENEEYYSNIETGTL